MGCNYYDYTGLFMHFSTGTHFNTGMCCCHTKYSKRLFKSLLRNVKVILTIKGNIISNGMLKKDICHMMGMCSQTFGHIVY